MRYVKDSPLELGHRVWQLRPPAPSLTVVVKGTFDPAAGDPAPFAAEPVPPTGEMHWEDDAEQSLRAPSDFPLIKPSGECFVIGKAWAPGGRPATAVACQFAFGTIAKSFAVFGDRRFTRGITWRLSDPVPFTEMELRMERAYGGPGYAPNPYGRGYAKVDGEIPAPNLEQAHEPVRSPGDRVDPVIIGPLPMSWPERLRYAGTYDARYMRERWPWLPADLDLRFFLEAPPDQRLREGFWRGDERFEAAGLHPSLPRVQSRLPCIAPRVFVDRRRQGRDRAFDEVALSLDTLTWDAAIGRLLLTWRGIVEVESEGLDEVDHIFVAHDPLHGPRRSRDELMARCDAILAAEEQEEEEAEGESPPELDDPVTPEAADEEPESEDDDEPSPEEAAIAAKIAQMQAQLAAMGIKAPDSAAEEPAPRDPAALLERMKQSGAPVPPELEAMIAELAAPEADELEPVETAEPEPESPPELDGRALVEACVADGDPLTELDLTGADLSGLDLRGVDFTASILAGAKLSQAKLEGATLRDCDLSGAELLRAELGGAKLDGAELSDANLQWADLMGASLEDATLDGARLVQARLSGAKAARASFVGADLTEALLTGGDFTEADFEGATLARVDATEAVLRDATLEEASAEAARFDRAVLTKVRAEGLKAREARFGSVDAEDSFWERAELSRADFSLSRLTRADFSDAVLIATEMDGCLLRGARFDRANAHSLRARKADCMEASFESADLSFADLRGTNLFGAELWRARTADAQLALAIVTRTKLE